MDENLVSDEYPSVRTNQGVDHMPRPVLTLWIVTAATLPTAGLVVLLTPQSPTLLSIAPIQPLLIPNARLSLNNLDSAFGKSLLPLAKSPVPQDKSAPNKLSAVVASSPSQTGVSLRSSLVVPRQPIATPSRSSPDKFQSITVPPFRPLMASIPSSVTSGGFSTASSRVFPSNKLEPRLTRPSKPIARSQVSLLPKISSLLPTAAPIPPSVVPTPTLATPSIQPSPERESSLEEIQSLCQKFPLNSRCQNLKIGLGTNSTGSTTPSAQPSPEREFSPEQIRSLCQKFPLNSHCKHNDVGLDTNSTGSTTPSAQPSPERELSPEEIRSLCQKFPLNSHCQKSTTELGTSLINEK